MNQDEFRKISRNISGDLNKFFFEYCNRHIEFMPIVETYTKKEIHKNGVQFYAGYINGGKEKAWDNYIEVPIILELIMLWAYKTNRVIDHKQEVWNKKGKVEEVVLEHDLILAIIFSLLDDVSNKLEEKSLKFSKIVNQLIGDMVRGFWIEKNSLNANNSELLDVLSDWESNYLKRNILFNSLYDLAPIIGYWISSDSENIFDLFEKQIPFEHRVSSAGQILNDLSDCVSMHDKHVKSYQDQFSDLRNGIITYPIFRLINELEVKKALKNKKLTLNRFWIKKFAELIKSKQILEEVEKICFDSYERNIDFWRSNFNVNDDMLFKTYWFLRDNKYFREFKK